MVSDTLCPAAEILGTYLNQSRAADLRGRCPIEPRGEFPFVRGNGAVRGDWSPGGMGRTDIHLFGRMDGQLNYFNKLQTQIISVLRTRSALAMTRI